MSSDIQKRAGAYLPHWTRENGIYAVCFRLAGTAPRKKIDELKTERNDILQTASVLKRVLSHFEQQSLNTIDAKLRKYLLKDGSVIRWLGQPDIASLAAKTLKHFEKKRYQLFAWSVMPTHLHAVVQPFKDHTLTKILHSWKLFIARRGNILLGRTGEFWHTESYDRLIRTPDELCHHISYAWRNPDVAGLRNWNWRWKIDDAELQSFFESSASPWADKTETQTVARLS